MTVAQPEDHQSSDFQYTFLSGKTVTLPRFQSVMTFGRARRIRKLDEAEQMFTLMEEICDDAALAVLDQMDTAETEAFFSAWQKDSGVELGGIASLILLMEQHRAAFDYDWRSRFHLPASVIGTDAMPWDESIRLLRVLRADPASQVAASLEGWDFPLDRFGWMLADLIDVQGTKAMGKKWKPYPRPAKAKDNSQRWGDTGGRTRTEVVAILNGLGHSLPV